MIGQSASTSLNALDWLGLAGKEFVAESANTTSVRLQIWSFAAQTFSNSPLLGQGFGGWQVEFLPFAEANGLNPAFPPHNTLIYLWSQSGLPAAMLSVIFMFLVLLQAWTLVRKGQEQDQQLGLLLALAAIWQFGQGMGENWGLWGDSHLLVLFATLVGWGSYAASNLPVGEPSSLSLNAFFRIKRCKPR